MMNLQADDPTCNDFNNIVQLHNLRQANWWTEVITLVASSEISDPETLESTSTDKKRLIICNYHIFQHLNAPLKQLIID